MATAMINWAAWAIESILTLAREKLRKEEESSPSMSLGDLPENVIEEILFRLPAKDAGRTAVLSRSWRHRWGSIPDLDLSAVSDLGVSQALRLHVGPIRLFRVDPADRFAVDGWLAALTSSSSGCLRTLDLSGGYPLQLGTLARSFPRLAHLCLFYTKMDMLRELDSSEFAFLQTLHLDHAYASVDDPYPQKLSMYVPTCPLLETLTVHHQTFSEGEKFFGYDLNSMARDYPRLTHLQLSDFLSFTIPSSSPGLTSLRTLNLASGQIYGDLSVLVSGCPLLENLSLKRVDLSGEERLDIVAPNLRFLELVEQQVEDFSIAAAPALETATIDISAYSTDDESDSIGDGEASGSCNLIKVLGGMPCIKRLHLGCDALRFLGKGHVPQKFPVSFDHLRYMSLKTDLQGIRVLQVILCLLKSTPNLQKLDFEGSYSSDMKFPGVGKDFWKTQEHEEHLGLFDNLEMVKVTNNFPFGAELEFIQFVLYKARVLKTMMVSFPHGPMRKKLLMSPRVSNQAKIIFTR